MATAKDARRGPAYRMAVAGRVALAACGGYLVAALATALLSLTLPMARPEAVATGTLISFAVMVAVVVWVFAAETLARAALAVAACALCLGAALWLAGGFPAASVAA